MAGPDNLALPFWFESGIFSFFKFSDDVIQQFTVDPKASIAVSKAAKAALQQQYVHGSCKSCGWKSKVRFGNPSNWVRHLKKHPNGFESYKKIMSIKKKSKRDRSPDSSYLPNQPSAKKLRADDGQEKISAALNPDTISKKKTVLAEKKQNKEKLPDELQERITMRIFDYIVADARPISTVDSTYFRNMLKEIDPRVNICCAKTLKKIVAKSYLDFKSKLKVKFESAVSVCLTADVWGSLKRSFLGITAHWLELDESGVMTRKSAGIACKRFEGHHTYDRIAEMIDGVMTDFALHAKVNYIVTDNGSNFVKAFKEFAYQQVLSNENSDNDDEFDPTIEKLVEQMVDNEDPEELSELQEAANRGQQNESTYDLLNNIDLESEIILPMHLRCASHTLNLIASTDIDLSKFENRQLPKKQALRKTLGKMTSLWNKICRSILAAELSKEAFGVALCTPCPTRWNSTYDSLDSFLSNYKSLDIANQLFTKLGLPSLTKEDIDLLNEYMLVMKPLAILLDIFQGEKGVFLGLGMVLPLLSKLKEQLKTKLFPNLNAIRDRVITSIDNRFGHLFDFTRQDSCTLAALTHPFFKAKWIKDKVARQEAIMLLKQLMTDVNTPIGEKSTTSITEDFLKYDLDESNESSNNNELENYLRDPDTSTAMLDKYPQIKQLFLKYNTAIPTSAPVERLFSQASIILTVRRNKLSDTLLEMLLLLKMSYGL